MFLLFFKNKWTKAKIYFAHFQMKSFVNTVCGCSEGMQVFTCLTVQYRILLPPSREI